MDFFVISGCLNGLFIQICQVLITFRVRKMTKLKVYFFSFLIFRKIATLFHCIDVQKPNRHERNENKTKLF